MATYTSFSELKDKQLEFGDEVQFTIKGEKLFYTVNKSFLEESVYTSNAIIFEKLNISDKNRYASLIYGYLVVGGKGEYSWPEFRENDYKAATKLVCNLFKKCEEIVKDSLYKKGDKVRVKDHYDPGSSEYDYPFTFTGEMLRNYGGEEVTITQVIPTTDHDDCKLYTEGYKYKIEEDGGFYSWCAAMFSGKVNKNTSTKEELYEVGDFVKIKEQDDPIHIPGFVDEMAKMYGGSWCKIREITLNGWFILETLGGNSIAYMWSKDMFSEHEKNLPTSTSHNSIEIPCSYEEVTLSIKKKKVHF